MSFREEGLLSKEILVYGILSVFISFIILVILTTIKIIGFLI